jgi:hypothetical protein
MLKPPAFYLVLELKEVQQSHLALVAKGDL